MGHGHRNDNRQAIWACRLPVESQRSVPDEMIRSQVGALLQFAFSFFLFFTLWLLPGDKQHNDAESITLSLIYTKSESPITALTHIMGYRTDCLAGWRGSRRINTAVSKLVTKKCVTSQGDTVVVNIKKKARSILGSSSIKKKKERTLTTLCWTNIVWSPSASAFRTHPSPLGW